MTVPEPAVPGTRWLIEVTAEAEVIPAGTQPDQTADDLPEEEGDRP